MMKYMMIPVLLLCSAGLFAQQKEHFTSVELQPTSAYLNHNGKEARMVRLLFHGGKMYSKATIRMAFNGMKDSVLVAADTAGTAVYELPLPGAPVAKETQLSVTVLSDGMQYSARCVVAPARKWQVYIYPHSHVDVGYTNVQEKVMKIHMDNIDEAIEIAKRTAGYPEGSRFKWNTEAVWVVDNYLARASEQKKKAFWETVKKGWINIDGAYGNINTSATDSRQLMQMFHTGRLMAKEHGFEMNTMFQGDVPGASWGLPAQSDITGIKYFLSAPNAGDRIGNNYKWKDKPFYWQSPSGTQKILFWQSMPYSIGYALKGKFIPNFFTVEDPRPHYTGHPSDFFLNPYLFNYLGELEIKGFPYNMTILTWAMSDNAPIDPELPDAVKAWNERYASPKLIITSVKQFFSDFEKKHAAELPVVTGDYTEYWTDGISSAARETGYGRNASDKLQQAEAIWAIRNRPAFPARQFDSAWTNLLMFNEHTWGAYNSVSTPNDPKAISQWNYKQAFVLNGKKQAEELLARAVSGVNTSANSFDVYNTLAQTRSGLVFIPAAQSTAGDLVKDASGKKIPSQRLKSGELAVWAQVPAFSKKRFTVSAGKATVAGKVTVTNNTIQNGIYKVVLDPKTGNITQLFKGNRNFADSMGLNRYSYLPGDSVEKIRFAGEATISIKEQGPLLASLLVTSSAPGTRSLQREIRLVAGEDRVEIINTIDKEPIGNKEGVHFAFDFKVPGAQVRYSIPWGSAMAEADQLLNANRNWYTVQRWVDVSNKDYGITWSTPDAPLFEIGNINTGGLLGSLGNSQRWIDFMEQSSAIYSWVMNNLWHTNFRRDQEGPATFRYYLHAHDAYNTYNAQLAGLSDHHPLIAAPAAGAAEETLFFGVDAKDVYVEFVKPAADGKAVLISLVNTLETPARVNLKGQLNAWESDIEETRKNSLGNSFELPGKGIIMVRVETK